MRKFWIFAALATLVVAGIAAWPRPQVSDLSSDPRGTRDPTVLVNASAGGNWLEGDLFRPLWSVNQSLNLTVRVTSSSAAVGSVTLFFQGVGAASFSYQEIPMSLFAGDGLDGYYHATVPGQSDAGLVYYYFTASNGMESSRAPESSRFWGEIVPFELEEVLP